MKGTFLVKFKNYASLLDQIPALDSHSFYHLFVSGQGYCIRYPSGKELKQIRQGRGNPSSFTELEDLIEKIEYKNAVSIKDNEVYWIKYLEILNSLPSEIHKQIKGNGLILDIISKMVIELLPEKEKVIRFTPLRELYGLLGDNIPGTLIRLFTQSIENLKNYSNDQPFKPEKRPTKIGDKPTTQLQLYFKKYKESDLEIIGDPQNSYRYLDHELAPLRSPNSLYETGESARKSGAGGIDIFCYNDESKLPVVIEYKSEKDHSLFYALIQSLTYASELLTSNQFKRINKHYYPPQVSSPSEKIEIMILFDKDKKIKDLEFVKEICRTMIDQGKFRKYIPRIFFVEIQKKLDKKYELRLKENFEKRK